MVKSTAVRIYPITILWVWEEKSNNMIILLTSSNNQIYEFWIPNIYN